MLLADFLGLILVLIQSYSDRKSEFSHSDKIIAYNFDWGNVTFLPLSKNPSFQCEIEPKHQ